MIQVLGSLCVVLAMLLFFVSFLLSGAFMARVPGGSQAVGLVIPLFCSIAAALLLLFGSALTLTAARWQWLGPHAGAWMMLLASGVGAAAVAALLAWMQRLGSWVGPVGIFIGGLAPLLAGSLILLTLWAPQRLTATRWPAFGVTLLGIAVLFGLGCGWMLLSDWWRLQQENRQRSIAAELLQQAETQRRDALSPLQALREDYAEHGADTPLWVYVSALLDYQDPALREFVIQRALAVPGFRADLDRTLLSTYPRFRHGAIELVLDIDRSALPDIATQLAQSMARSAKEIAEQADWMTPDARTNPYPSRHLSAMHAVAQAFAQSAAVHRAMLSLQAACAARGIPMPEPAPHS